MPLPRGNSIANPTVGLLLCAVALFGVLSQQPARSDDEPATPSVEQTTPADTSDSEAPAPSADAEPPTDAEAKSSPAEQPAVPQPPPPPPPIDQQPYRVLVTLAVAPDLGLDARFREDVIEGVRERVASRLGPLWDAEIEPADWLSPGRRAVLDHFTEADLNAQFLESEYDKVFLATVERDGIATRLSAREWDKNSQTATPATSSLNYEPRIVIDRLFAEILSHFRPIGEVEEIFEDGHTLEMRLRGGELLPPDASLRPATAGRYLRPYYRYFNRKKELQKLQEIPWTYLEITEVNRGRMLARIDSAFPGALAGKRRRTELMAIGVKLRFDDTRIRIYPRGQSDNPVSATRIDVMDRHPTDDDPVDDRLTLYTDRFGEVAVPANSDHPLQYIYVMSGKSVLAIVPYIAGERPQTELEVPDDAPRLAVEGEIAILEAELIEVVARREVAINRALGHARANEWEPADKLMNEVKDLPTKDQILERLERIRLPAVAGARRTGNRVGVIRINRMCETFKETINQHLDPDRVNAFQTEIFELKQAAGAN